MPEINPQNETDLISAELFDLSEIDLSDLTIGAYRLHRELIAELESECVELIAA